MRNMSDVTPSRGATIATRLNSTRAVGRAKANTRPVTMATPRSPTRASRVTSRLADSVRGVMVP